jgi:hypothetical protein
VTSTPVASESKLPRFTPIPPVALSQTVKILTSSINEPFARALGRTHHTDAVSQ